jgi:hypothetical protein
MNESKIARAYLRKIQSAKDRGITFKLSLLSFSNLMKAKRCAYTHILLTEPVSVKSGQKAPVRGTDRTLERIDNSKGYEKGNVIAVCHGANELKNLVCEMPGRYLNLDHFIKMAKVLEKRAKVLGKKRR